MYILYKRTGTWETAAVLFRRNFRNSNTVSLSWFNFDASNSPLLLRCEPVPLQYCFLWTFGNRLLLPWLYPRGKLNKKHKLSLYAFSHIAHILWQIYIFHRSKYYVLFISVSERLFFFSVFFHSFPKRTLSKVSYRFYAIKNNLVLYRCSL